MTPSAIDERGQRHRLREQHADHGGDGLRQVVEAQQLERIAADDQRDQDEAADDRHGDQGLEQRVGDELDEHDLPIRGRDEGAAFEGELQQSSHSTMTVRMTFPSFVTRAAKRIALGGVVAAAAIAVAALVIERTAAWRRPRGVAREAAGPRWKANSPRWPRGWIRPSRAVTLDAGIAAASRARRCRGHAPAVRSGGGQRGANRTSRSRSTAPPTSRSPGSADPRMFPTPGCPGRRRRSWRRAARACSWCASSRSSIRPIRRGTSARSSPKRSCRGPADAAAGFGVFARHQHCAGRAAPAVRRRRGCRSGRVRHSLVDRTNRWRR